MDGKTTSDSPTPFPNQWDAELYDSKHSFVSKLGTDLLELLLPQPGECILDLGCGTGHLTDKIASVGAEVVGIDSASSMIEQARRNYPNLQFEVGDATNLQFTDKFDAVFSNAVLHYWIKMFASNFFQALPADKQADIFADIENQLRPQLYKDDTWFADYKRIRVIAIKF